MKHLGLGLGVGVLLLGLSAMAGGGSPTQAAEQRSKRDARLAEIEKLARPHTKSIDPAAGKVRLERAKEARNAERKRRSERNSSNDAPRN